MKRDPKFTEIISVWIEHRDNWKDHYGPVFHVHIGPDVFTALNQYDHTKPYPYRMYTFQRIGKRIECNGYVVDYIE